MYGVRSLSQFRQSGDAGRTTLSEYCADANGTCGARWLTDSSCRHVQSQVELPGPPSAGGGGYRLALALSRDGKVRTPWLSVLGARAPPVPYIDVLLHADSVDLLRAEARVESMLADDTALYEELVTHWLNGTAWPKSILVKWHWADDARGASHRALTIALTVCVGLATLALLRAVLPASRDLANLTADLVEGFQHKAD